MEGCDGEIIFVKFHVGVGNVSNDKGVGEIWVQQFSVRVDYDEVVVDDFTLCCSQFKVSSQDASRT